MQISSRSSIYLFNVPFLNDKSPHPDLHMQISPAQASYNCDALLFSFLALLLPDYPFCSILFSKPIESVLIYRSCCFFVVFLNVVKLICIFI